jgi:hypothetical protein
VATPVWGWVSGGACCSHAERREQRNTVGHTDEPSRHILGLLAIEDRVAPIPAKVRGEFVGEEHGTPRTHADPVTRHPPTVGQRGPVVAKFVSFG